MDKTSQSDDYVRAKFRALSDGELCQVVVERRDDYTDEAIELAWEELRRRGVDPADRREVPEDAAAHDGSQIPLQRGAAPLGTKWLEAYVALLGASSFAGPFVPLLTGQPFEDALYALPGSALGLTVAYGLIKRRLWGWYANWGLLALIVVLILAMRGAAGGVGSLLGAVLNGIYFARRRQLFD